MIQLARMIKPLAAASLVAALAMAALGALPGCQSQPQASDASIPEDLSAANDVMVENLFDQSAQNAAAAERIVYPYQFVPNDKHLNELGQRQVHNLAPVYLSGPGRLSVPRGDVPAELYQARIESVSQALARDGVDLKQVTFVQDMPGGPGIASEAAVKALEKPIKSESERQSTMGSSGSNGSSGSTGSSSSSGSSGGSYQP